MRRLMSLAAFSLFLSLPLWAQHGGGHASFGGGHSGGFSGHSSFSGTRMGASHFSGGARSGFSGGSLHSAHPGSSRSTFSQNRIRIRTGFPNRGFRNNCFGFPCRSGYAYPWYGYDP